MWFLLDGFFLLNKSSFIECPVVESAKDADFILFRNLVHLDDIRVGILGLLICEFINIESTA